MFSIKYKSDRPIAAIRDDILGRQTLYFHMRPPKHSVDTDYFDKIGPINGSISVLPETRPRQRDCISVSAAPGSGKSTFVCEYIKNFYKEFPHSPKVLLYTTQASDDFDIAYLPVKDRIEHITIDDEFIDEKPALAELAYKDEDGKYLPSLVLFDDIETSTKKLHDAVNGFRNTIAANGRKLGIYLIYVSTQMPLKEASYREFLGNCTGIVIWPKYPPLNIAYILEAHFGITAAAWKRIKSFTDDYVYMNRTGVPYLIGNKQAFILNQDREEELGKMYEKQKKDDIKKLISHETTI